VVFPPAVSSAVPVVADGIPEAAIATAIRKTAKRRVSGLFLMSRVLMG
jgi:hypothetical protein